VTLSREQVFRLVTQPPQQLSMDTLVALCDILDCTPNDLNLIEPAVANKQVRKATAVRGRSAPLARRTSIRRPSSRDRAVDTGHLAARAGRQASLPATHNPASGVGIGGTACVRGPAGGCRYTQYPTRPRRQPTDAESVAADAGG